ncbi:MAG: alpha/beta hydrolase [Cyanobacteria bacterium P01_A01_bin.17]
MTVGSVTLGSGPPVLLLPAFSTVSTRAELATLADALAAHFQVTLLDWPGFGDSDRPPLDYQPALYRAFLQAFVRDNFTQDVAVVAAGHAAGYALVLQSWSRIVLIAPTWRGPLAVMGAPAAVRNGVRELVRLPLIGQALYGLNTRPGFLKWMYQRHVFVDETQLTPDYMAQRYQNTQKTGARYAPAAFVTGGLDPADERADFLGMLEQQPVPVMVIVADQAPPSSKAEMEAMTQLPDVQVAHLPGSLGMAEEFGDAIAPAILPFLQEGIAPAGSQLSS